MTMTRTLSNKLPTTSLLSPKRCQQHQRTIAWPRCERCDNAWQVAARPTYNFGMLMSTLLQNESAKANRQDLISEVNTHRERARNLAKLERKRKMAEAMGEKREAEETGEDLERKRAWEYSIEDNEKWDKKQARKQRRADFSFTGAHESSCGVSRVRSQIVTGLVGLPLTDYDDIARRKYKKVRFEPPPTLVGARRLTDDTSTLQDMDTFKPDLVSYNKQREAAEQSLALVGQSGSGALVPGSAADLYRDANSFVYADHKPSEDAIDKVIHKINLE